MRHAAYAASRELLQLKNVRFLTVGQKRLTGARTPVPAVVAYVSRKESVGSADRVPDELPFPGGGAASRMKTDVVELVTRPAAFGVEAGKVLVASDQNYGGCTLTFIKNRVGFALDKPHAGCDSLGGGSFFVLEL